MTDSVDNLVDLLQSGSPPARLEAAEQLARLGDDARPAAVALVEALETDDDQLREWAAAALEELGPPAKADVVRLASLLARPSLDVAYWAATLLGRLEADAAEAVPSLVAGLEHHSELAVRERSAWALGRIGPTARAASDALTKAARSPNARLASLADQARRRLGLER